MAGFEIGVRRSLGGLFAISLLCACEDGERAAASTGGIGGALAGTGGVGASSGGIGGAPGGGTTSGGTTSGGSAGEGTGGVSLGGKPVFGSTHTPNNRPIADWEADILKHYGGSSVVDAAATADLQECIASSGTWGAPYVVFGQNSYTIYYAENGDPEHPMTDSSGSPRSCPLDAGKGWAGVRIPAGAHVWSATDSNAITLSDDTHITIVDVERNRMYAFYGGAGQKLGVTGGAWQSPYRGCDLLSADGTDGTGDAALLAAQGYDARYGCKGGGYPAAACGLPGGAGVAQNEGSGFGNGDSNGFIGGYGVIVPEDFDDTGWSGAAVGTLHHALRCSNPQAYQYGYIWPMQDPQAGNSSRHLRNGQIIRLDPSIDVAALGAPAWEQRLLRTLQVYGCVLSDYATYGMALFAESGWDGVGPNRGPNPWTEAGGANAEARAMYTSLSSNGVKFGALGHLDMTKLEVVLPHGAAYYP